MPYNVTGARDTDWGNQAFDGLGQAVRAAVANMEAGWRDVRIECPDNTVLREGLIREIHDAVESGSLDA